MVLEIIDAVWEKRNLGCDTVEIRYETQDKSLQIEKLQELKQPYQVIKIPTGKNGLFLQAQEIGFQVMECQVTFKRILKDFEIPKKYQRFVKDVSYHIASDEEAENTLQCVKTGNIFTTDRIALDPNFSTEIAGYRYANWIQDLLKKGYTLYMKTFKGEVFGWSINNSSISKKVDMVLGSNFQERTWNGMGIAGIYLNTHIAQVNGGIVAYTTISTNNLRNIRLHMEYGYMIERMEYVLIRHI